MHTLIRAMVCLSLMGLATKSLAYQVGDTLDPAIAKTLNLNPNKITVVDFFASWCASCKKEIPMLDAMSLDNNTVEILGVCTDKKLEKGQAFQRKLDIQFRVHNDTAQTVVAAFAPFGMPAIYLVQNNIVKKVHFGAMPHIDRVIQKDLNRLLALESTQ